MDTTKVAKTLGLAVSVILLGGTGWLGTACVAHLYNDHLLVDAARQAAQPRPPSPAPPQ